MCKNKERERRRTKSRKEKKHQKSHSSCEKTRGSCRTRGSCFFLGRTRGHWRTRGPCRTPGPSRTQGSFRTLGSCRTLGLCGAPGSYRARAGSCLPWYIYIYTYIQPARGYRVRPSKAHRERAPSHRRWMAFRHSALTLARVRLSSFEICPLILSNHSSVLRYPRR